MKELGFPVVKEIPNSGNITSLLSCGVTHRSPFAQQWFAIFQGQESTVTGVSIQKFANDTSNKLFWTKSLAVPTVAQVQVERNSFAKYIHDILAMKFFPVPDFKQLANKDLSESDLLKLAFEQALDGDYDVSGKIHEGPKVGGIRKFRLAFIAPASVAASPIARSKCHQASTLASPSSQSPMATGEN